MKMQRLTPWLVLVPLTFVTGLFGQNSPMSDSQKIEYLMQQVQELQAQVKELKTTQQLYRRSRRETNGVAFGKRAESADRDGGRCRSLCSSWRIDRVHLGGQRH